MSTLIRWLQPGFRSYIDLPLIKQCQTIGTIKFLSRQKGGYTVDQVDLAKSVAPTATHGTQTVSRQVDPIA